MKRNALLIIGILVLPLLLTCIPPPDSDNSTLPSVPEAPVLSSPFNSAINISITPTLTWSTVNEATAYRVQVSTASTFATTILNDSLTGTYDSITTPLVASTVYYWRVNAKNAGGSSAWSSTYNFTTIVAVPVSPALSIPADAATGITTVPTLTWGTVTGAATYRVQVSTGSAFATTVADDSTVTTGTKILTTALANNATYYWRVDAKNTGGTSAWSLTYSFTTIVAAPVSPALSIPANTAIGIATVPTLTWGTVTGAATYRVQVSTGSGFATTVADDSTVTKGTKTRTTALANNATYYWRVNAKNTRGTSSWSAIWSFTTVPLTVTDADGNVYHTVTIGTQTWTVENLKTSKYNDGSTIPLVTNGTTWSNLTTPGYCWYNNDASTYKTTYGALYNWYAVNTGKLAPAGWHVPTDAEWDTLSAYLGGDNGSGGKLKEAGTTHWSSPNTGATNETGFSALPGGYRSNGGSFSYIGFSGFWWSATEYDASTAYYRTLLYIYSNLGSYNYYKSCGFCVRLLRD